MENCALQAHEDCIGRFFSNCSLRSNSFFPMFNLE